MGMSDDDSTFTGSADKAASADLNRERSAPLGERFEIREVTAYCTYRVGASEPVAVSWNRASAENCRAMCERNEWPWYSRPPAAFVKARPLATEGK